MKLFTRLFSLVALGVFLSSQVALGQITINEGFEGTTTPTGWNYTGYSRTTTTTANYNACAGSAVIRGNRYSSSTTGNAASPIQTSNGQDLTISFKNRIINFSGGGFPAAGWGSVITEVSVDGGTNYTITAGTIDSGNHTNSTSCNTVTYVVPAASVPNGVSVRIRVRSTWVLGDWYTYIDDFSAVQPSVTPPACVATPTAPTNAATNVGIAGTLTWPTSPGATSYDVYLGTSMTPALVGNVTTTSYAYTGLMTSTAYNWQIIPKNANGDATGCSVWSFTTFTPPSNDLCANAIDLGSQTSPLSGSTAFANDDDLQTCALGNTSPDIYYYIDVPNGKILSIGQTVNGYDSENYVGYGGTCGTGTQIDCFDDPDTKTVTWLNCTGMTQRVYWVQDGYSGSTDFGTFTLAWSITDPAVPVCGPGATAPANNSTNQAVSGNITWAAVANACSYDVFLDTNNPPTTLLGTFSTLTAAYTGLATGTQYFVQIVPKNITGSATGCTVTNFTTTSSAPNCTTITSPANASVNRPVSGNITYAASAGATSYDVFLDTNDPPSTLLGNFPSTTAAYAGLLNSTLYYVQIVPKNAIGSATGCPITNFTTIAPPPANDECSNAIALTVNPDLACGSQTAGTIASATASAGVTTTCGGTPNDDVWFSFVATATSHKIDLLSVAGSTTDLYHAVFSGSCGALTQVLCSDPNSSTVTGLTINNTYYLRVYSWSSSSGATSTFNVCIGTPPQPPANDNPTGAISLTVNPSCTYTSGTTAGATSTTPNGYSNPVGTTVAFTPLDVWYTATTDASGAGSTGLFITVNKPSGSTMTTAQVALFSATSNAGPFTFLSASTATSFSGTFTLNATGLTPSTTYYIRVAPSGSSDPVGTFEICVTVPPTCLAPTGLVASAITQTTATLSWTAPASGTTPTGYTWIIMADGVAPNLATALYNGTVSASPVSVTGLSAASMYDAYVRTDCGGSDISGWSSKFDLTTLSPPPANDDCASAVNINGGGIAGNPTGTPISATTAGATQSQPSCNFGSADDDIWFTFTTDADGGDISVVVVGGTGFDAVVQIFSGACESLTSLVCQDGTGSGGTETATVSSAPADSTYYIRVYDYFTGFTGSLNDRAAGAFTIAASGSALPVELLSFTGQAMEKSNKLTWKTATEENAGMFIVERSADGRTGFEAIAEVKAAGNSLETIMYTAEDLNPLGMNYYRLKMVDLDGTFEYSSIVTVERKDKGVNFVNVFPVPTSAGVTVVYTTPEVKDITVVVTDLMGRNMQTLQLVSNKGVNNQAVDMTAMPAGTYFISITDGVSQQVRRITKQ